MSEKRDRIELLTNGETEREERGRKRFQGRGREDKKSSHKSEQRKM